VSDLVARLRAALERRRDLPAQGTTAYRVLNGAADGVPDVVVDRFEDVLVASFYRPMARSEEQRWVDALARVARPRAVYVKRRPREARVEATTRRDALAPSSAAWGEERASVVVRENGLRYQVRPGQGLSVGLYLDMRDTRAWVRRSSAGLRVLNLFAYTCAFGVCARAGGAARVVNVDLSRRVLDWGAENAALNGQPAPPEDCVAAEAAGWLARCQRRGEAFELVILDPPSFSTSRHGAFSAAKDYPKLVAAAAPAVTPSGALVACCNLAQMAEGVFGRKIEAGLAAAGRKGRRLERLGASTVDFPSENGAFALKVLIYALA
jgi:23S rRNA (cytosine1962-C5)-methyltransferase